MRGLITVWRGLAAVGCLVLLPLEAKAQVAPGKQDPDGMTFERIQAALPEYFPAAGDLRARPAAIPDVIGPGAVIRVGNVYMKVTNFGHCGNYFQNLTSDPSGQWRCRGPFWWAARGEGVARWPTADRFLSPPAP